MYIAENDMAFATFDNWPISKGHTLIIPKRHFQDFFSAEPEEMKQIYNLINDVKNIIDKKYHPDGYNIATNCGYYAGQTIMHFHVHLIPRYKGDVENPKGGLLKLNRKPYKPTRL